MLRLRQQELEKPEKVLLLLRIRSETLQNRVQNQRWIQKHLLKRLFMRLEMEICMQRKPQLH